MVLLPVVWRFLNDYHWSIFNIQSVFRDIGEFKDRIRLRNEKGI